MAINKVAYGNQTLIDLTDTTATASDVASGKYFYDVAGVKTLGTASGGGGLTSVVRGTFKYTAEGWNTISLPYSGSGYPIAAYIFIKNGYLDSTFYNTARQYAFSNYSVLKSNTTTAPTYTGTGTDSDNGSVIIYRHKSNATTATSMSVLSTSAVLTIYGTNEATATGATSAFRISGQKEIKVRMVEVGVNTSRYGFLVNTDYTYVVVYSS